MTNKEHINRNIGLTFDFVHSLIENPKLIDQLPEKFRLEFIEKDFSQMDSDEKEKHNDQLIKKFVKVRNKFEMVA